MSAIRVRSGAASASPPTGPIPGARESRLSRYFLWWLPVAPFVGCPGGNGLRPRGRGGLKTSEAALLGALLMAPFAVGVYLGLRSRPEGLPGRLGGLRREPPPGRGGDRHADRGVPHWLTT